MQPLGTAALMAAYYERLSSGHDATMTVQVLSPSERVLGSARLIDGQVNLHRATMIRRTATLSLLDADRSLGLDDDSPWAESNSSANRLIRVQHTIDVPGFGDVTATVFVGPVASTRRDGAVLELECQDKTALVVRGTMPYKVGKGANAVSAIRKILSVRYGETKFRLPRGVRTRLPWPAVVGFKEEASGWVTCQRIARLLGMQLLYSCDGYVTLREWPHSPAALIDEDWLTSVPVGERDFTEVVNYARVSVGQFWRTANLRASHPLSPNNPAGKRNGVPLYRPAVEELAAPPKPGKGAKPTAVRTYKKRLENRLDAAAARARAMVQVDQLDLSWTQVPMFHLDVGDIVRLRTEAGAISLRLSTGTIPLGVGGDMVGGVLRPRSRPRLAGRR